MHGALIASLSLLGSTDMFQFHKQFQALSSLILRTWQPNGGLFHVIVQYYTYKDHPTTTMREILKMRTCANE